MKGTGIIPLAVMVFTDDAVFLRQRDKGVLGGIVQITAQQAAELVLAAHLQFHYVSSTSHVDGTLLEIIARKDLIAYAKSKGWSVEAL